MKDSIKLLLIQVLGKQAFAALVRIPGFGFVFALPVVRTVVQFIIDRIITWAVQETAVGLSVLWIQIDMAGEINSALDAEAKLRDMLEHPQRYSYHEQKLIEEHFDDSTVDLIQLGIKRLG